MLHDSRLSGYFQRQLVHYEDVIDALIDGGTFDQALHRESYSRYDQIRRDIEAERGEPDRVISSGAFNVRTAAIFLGLLAFLITWPIELSQTSIATWSIYSTSYVTAAISAALFAGAQSRPGWRFFRIATSALLLAISILTAAGLHALITYQWPAGTALPLWILALAVFYLIPKKNAGRQCLDIILLSLIPVSLWVDNRRMNRYRVTWLEDCIEDVIMPQAVLVINTILGEDKDRLLVEQDSEGLRKLQDPDLTVPTFSERRLKNVLSQMDGGSIALAGPRGAGKSTLLRKFSGAHWAEMSNQPCISVYMAAPAEYIPRDFIAELLQRLCEAYLEFVDSPSPEPIYRERRMPDVRRLLARSFRIIWLSVRTLIAIAILVWVVHEYIKIDYRHVYSSVLTDLKNWYNNAKNDLYNFLYAKVSKYWTLLHVLVGFIVALAFWPGLERWRGHVHRRKEPPLAQTAREYLLRLRVDKTVTWGRVLKSPSVHGVSMSINTGGTASYIPWSLPELVSHTRRFMNDVSKRFARSSHAVMVGIDEIDRIGSVDQAEKFIGEIKAVFGVEKCFFLVAVAEDVGSIFAQRATAGRSILENAFDDIVVVEPLNVQEARELLLKRVPGFTDSFVYLVHVLSGGLPRELIRVTRRLVEVNHEARSAVRHPRLEDLAFALVKEELIESIRAARNQLSRLTLNPAWNELFEKLRASSLYLRSASPLSLRDSYSVIDELSRLSAPAAIQRGSSPLVADDEEKARHITDGFTAFAHFGITVIDAFSDKFFNLGTVQHLTANGLSGSYEELAAARTELSVSSGNCRKMLTGFRDSLGSFGPGSPITDP